MDVLTDVLNTLELKGWLCSRTEIAAPWRLDFAACRDSVFHIFNFGGGYLDVEGESSMIQRWPFAKHSSEKLASLRPDIARAGIRRTRLP